MTRLKSDWLRDMEKEAEDYGQRLHSILGMDLITLACRAAGIPDGSRFMFKNRKVAVIRVTSGKGVIGYFAESVAAITKSMGTDTFITDACDVAGVYEALSENAEVLFMADDERFIAFNTKTGAVGENDIATVSGYVTGLSAMAGGLAGRDVILLGYGRIGEKALLRLLDEGARVSVYDCDEEKIKALHNDINEITVLCDKAPHCSNVKILSSPPQLLTGPVFDATNQGGYLSIKDLAGDALIAAPGIPLSLDEEAYAFYRNHKQIMHDPLQTGTAVMLAMALKDV